MQLKFNELDTVKTLINFPEKGVAKCELGAIVHVFWEPCEAYEVEFVNEDGSTKAMFAVLPNQITKA